jgi:hypothetical protein
MNPDKINKQNENKNREVSKKAAERQTYRK